MIADAFGRSAGTVTGEALGVPSTTIAPAAWKRRRHPAGPRGRQGRSEALRRWARWKLTEEQIDDLASGLFSAALDLVDTFPTTGRSLVMFSRHSVPSRARHAAEHFVGCFFPDGGKKLVGFKRLILVDADGRLLAACVSPVDMRDSRAAPNLLRASRQSWPFVETVWADSAYRGERVAATPIRVAIVTGPPNQRGFIVQKRRWVVERTIAWIARNRRLAKDYERHASTALAFIFLAAASILMKRVCAAS